MATTKTAFVQPTWTVAAALCQLKQKSLANPSRSCQSLCEGTKHCYPCQGDNDSVGNDRNDNDNEFESLTLDALDGWLLRKSLLDAFLPKPCPIRAIIPIILTILKNEMKLAANAQSQSFKNQSTSLSMSYCQPGWTAINLCSKISNNSKDLQDFVHHLKPSANSSGYWDKVVGNFYSDKFGALDVQNTDGSSTGWQRR